MKDNLDEYIKESLEKTNISPDRLNYKIKNRVKEDNTKVYLNIYFSIISILEAIIFIKVIRYFVRSYYLKIVLFAYLVVIILTIIFLFITNRKKEDIIIW